MGRDEVLLRLNVSRETAAALDAYVALLIKWQARINLIADSTLDDIWFRHILDSGQLAALGAPARRWTDLGSGAGLPGLVVAILLAPDAGARVTLIEANHKKCAFLREAIRATKAPAQVVSKRIEAALGEAPAADMVTARALAPLNVLVNLAAPQLLRGAQALFPKGRQAEAELTEARKSWRIDARLLPSATDTHGRIVHIRSLSASEAG